MKRRAIILFLMAIPGIAILTYRLLNFNPSYYDFYKAHFDFILPYILMILPAFLDIFVGIRALCKRKAVESSRLDTVLFWICVLTFCVLLLPYLLTLYFMVLEILGLPTLPLPKQ